MNPSDSPYMTEKRIKQRVPIMEIICICNCNYVSCKKMVACNYGCEYDESKINFGGNDNDIGRTNQTSS